MALAGCRESHFPARYRAVPTPILNGLHHEYRWVPEAAWRPQVCGAQPIGGLTPSAFQAAGLTPLDPR